ncbi:MAG: Holliday junction branch migration protein RuvA [Candidatus Brocadiaceae bacterium]|nr:Holliday junction branch migration protein RuvA [Candidatus Brocadiaceae bacterium]
MIDRLQGRLVVKSPTAATIDVGGVGLVARIPLSTYEALPPEGGRAVLLTHLLVREDELCLFGFATELERELFRMLLPVSRIGPAVALRVLSSCEPGQFKRYILDGNADALKSTVKGIGAKTASRLIVELRERIERLPVAAEEAGSQAARDAVQALVALGEPEADARQAVRAAVARLGPDADRQQLVQDALGH